MSDDFRDDRNDHGGSIRPRRAGEQPAAKTGTPTWVWALFGGGVAGLLLCCVGAYIATQRVKQFAGELANEFAMTVIEDYTDAPAMQEHIGTVTSASMNVFEQLEQDDDGEDEAGKAAEEAADEEDSIIITVEGDRGRGELVFRTELVEATDATTDAEVDDIDTPAVDTPADDASDGSRPNARPTMTTKQTVTLRLPDGREFVLPEPEPEEWEDWDDDAADDAAEDAPSIESSELPAAPAAAPPARAVDPGPSETNADSDVESDANPEPTAATM